jgi:hypothetical protein
MAFDLDKVIAEYAGTAKKRRPYPFTFDGEKFTLPGEYDMIAVRMAAEMDLLSAFQRLLGPEQYAKVVASPTLLSPQALNAILDDYYKFLAGMAAGESSASSRSSKSTARRSSTTSANGGRSRSRR